MAKVQTRRGISVSRGVYADVGAFCDANKVSMSSVAEAGLKHVLKIGIGNLHRDETGKLEVIDHDAPPVRTFKANRTGKPTHAVQSGMAGVQPQRIVGERPPTPFDVTDEELDAEERAAHRITIPGRATDSPDDVRVVYDE